MPDLPPTDRFRPADDESVSGPPTRPMSAPPENGTMAFVPPRETPAPAYEGATIFAPSAAEMQVGPETTAIPTSAIPIALHLLAPPAAPGRYIIGPILARGGMGEVHTATDTYLNRDVAVKTLRPDQADADAARRFLDEAKITGRLQHPGIPPVHDLGTLPDGRPFIAMKLIRGDTLAARLYRRTASQEQPGLGGGITGRDADTESFLLAVFEQVCQTVGYAHSLGIIHRDLKPGNLMVGAFGEVQVMDWGLAKDLNVARIPDPSTDEYPAYVDVTPHFGATKDSTAPKVLSGFVGSDHAPTQTLAGSVMGTLAYMPPEQARGETEAITRPADVFALGAILGEILTGYPPFSGKPQEMRSKSASGDLTEILGRLSASGADPELVALAAWCLAVPPEDRPPDAGAVAHAVGEYRAGVAERLKRIELYQAQVAVRAAELQKRRRVQGVLAGVLGLLFLGSAGAAWWMERAEARRVADAEVAQANLARLEADKQKEHALDEAKFLKERERREADAVRAEERLKAEGVLAEVKKEKELAEAKAKSDAETQVKLARAEEKSVAELNQVKERAETEKRILAQRAENEKRVIEERAATEKRLIADRAAQAKLQTARNALDQANTAAKRGKWEVVDLALKQAAAQMTPETPADLREGLATQQKNLKFVMELERLSEASADKIAWQSELPLTVAAYYKAFAEYGFPLDQPPVNLQNALRDSPVADPFQVALYALLNLDPNETGRRRVAQFLAQLDPKRLVLQDALAAKNPEIVKSFTTKLNWAELPPALAAALGSTPLIETDVRIKGLQTALIEHPDEFELANQLAFQLAARHTLMEESKKPEFLNEVLVTYRIALAIRPQSPMTWDRVGFFLCANKQYEAGETAYRRAIALETGASRSASMHLAWQFISRQERPAEVWSLLRVASQVNKPDAMTLSLLAAAALKTDNFGPAAQRIRAKLAPDTPTDEAFATRVWYNAALTALWASVGAGTNPPPDAERPALRAAALDWLKRDLAAWKKSKPAELPAKMKAWLSESQFAPVRNPMVFYYLPPGDRTQWAAFWAEVKALSE